MVINHLLTGMILQVITHLFSAIYRDCNFILEDYEVSIIPMTCKWIITMVIGSPLYGVIPLINGLFMAYKWGLLTTY